MPHYDDMRKTASTSTPAGSITNNAPSIESDFAGEEKLEKKGFPGDGGVWDSIAILFIPSCSAWEVDTYCSWRSVSVS